MRGLLIAAALLACGTALAQPVPPQSKLTAPGSAVVLMYHRFGEAEHPSTNIRMEQFRAHLAELSKPQYTVLPLPRIVAMLRAGQTLPDRTVAITIDDAYRSIYTQAWPLLREARLPFTIFIATEALDRGYADLMRWEQVRELSASGLVTLGNHTATHLHMPDASRAQNRRELEQAARRIAAETGQAPTLFAYPYGETSLAAHKEVEAAGLLAAFGQHSGAIGAGSPLLLLPRFALNEHYGSIERFRMAVNALPLPVTDVIPLDTVISTQDNPPLFGFTVGADVGTELGAEVGSIERLTCYVSGQAPLPYKRVGPRRIEGRPLRPFPPGRSRINCTLPAGGGRWRWFGIQFYRPGS